MSKPTTAPLFFRPDEYARAGAAAANAAPAAAWRQACGEAAAALQSPDSAAAAASAGALFAGDVAARALAVRILEAAARRGAGGGDSGGGAGAAATAAACGLADAPAQELAAQCEQHGEALRAALHLRVPSLPRLLALRTRVDVAITSDSVAKVMRPVITLEASLSDDRVLTFEAPADRFNELRYAVAKLLSDMAAVEAQPVLKIA